MIKEEHPFEPIYDENSKILILGSFPSVKSREANFYYSHPQNRFWRVLAKIHKQKLPVTVGQKRRFLLDNNIAIWDVVKSCNIVGSSDSSITDVEVNDITFLLKNTNIKEIYFNGKIPYMHFSKNFNEVLGEDIKIAVLPSTSSANAKFTLEKLSAKWKEIVYTDLQEESKDLKNDKCIFKPSISEKHGIDLISDSDMNILSIGVSTAGSAEIEMAKKNPNAHIIATTIDKEGLNYTQKIINQYGLQNKIELRLEDVSKKLPYNDAHFDFIYARLVLHYLDDMQLEQTLTEIKRILKKDGSFYIVVRSQNEWEANLPDATYDEKTGLTRYPVKKSKSKNVEYIYRRFHTIDSLQSFLESKQFKVQYIKEYKEQLYSDYKRTKKTKYENTIIECLCKK